VSRHGEGTLLQCFRQQQLSGLVATRNGTSNCWIDFGAQLDVWAHAMALICVHEKLALGVLNELCDGGVQHVTRVCVSVAERGR